MAGGYQESHEVLRKHGGTVHGLTDRLQGVTNPSEWKTAPASASYRKMSYSGFEMTSIRVHSRGRLSWAVAPGLISGDRVGVSA